MSSPRHLAPRGRRSWRERVLLGLGVGLTILCVVVAGGVGYGYWRYSQITRYDVDLPPAAEGEPQNFLLVGSDSRANLDPTDLDYEAFVDDTSPTGGQRTDTIMILRVDPDEETADLLSLPRDLWVPIGDAEGRENRINSAYGQGRQVLIDTIQSSLGIPVNHYVEVDFAGFKDLIEEIGGVNLYFDAPVRDDNTGLDVDSAGCYQLDATQSLAFVRSRHIEIQRNDGTWVSDPSADLGRISRQQLFIRRAVSKALSKGLTNPVTLNNLVSVGVDNVGLDPGLDVDDLLSFGRRFADFDEESLRTHTVATYQFRTSGGASVLGLEEEESEDVLNIFRGLPDGTVRPEFVDLTVLNGSGVENQATDVAAALGKLGFTIDVIGDASEPFSRSALYFPPGAEHAALAVAAHLTTKPVLVADPELDPDEREIVLVTGPDFTTVHEQPSTDGLDELLPSSTTTTTTATAEDGSTTPSSTTSTTDPIGYTPQADNAEAAACT